MGTTLPYHKRGRFGTIAEVFGMLFLLCCFLLLAVASPASAGTKSWTDISQNTLTLYDLKAADLATFDPGFADGTWRPDLELTRAEAVKWFVVGFEIPLANPESPHFSDVLTDDEFYQYVEGAYEAGFISGYPDGTFRPNGAVLRMQAATLVIRWLEAERGWDIPTAYTEEEVDAILGAYEDGYLVPYGIKWEVAFAVDHGIIWGDADGHLFPARQVTRIELASMIVHALDVPASLSPGAHWTDMTPEIWTFYDVTPADLRKFSRGFPDRTWRPYCEVLRKQAVAAAAIALGIPVAFPEIASYEDVAPGTFYYQYIEGATLAGLVYGVPTEEGIFFYPDDSLTRLQGALFMVRWIVANRGYDPATMYTDDEVNAILDAAYPDEYEVDNPALRRMLAFATEFGIIRADEDGWLSPQNNLRRIELASMIVHALDVPAASD